MTDKDDMTAEKAPQEIHLHYTLVDGQMRIDIDSDGFEQDPNIIAMYLSFTLDQLLAQAGESEPT